MKEENYASKRCFFAGATSLTGGRERTHTYYTTFNKKKKERETEGVREIERILWLVYYISSRHKDMEASEFLESKKPVRLYTSFCKKKKKNIL